MLASARGRCRRRETSVRAFVFLASSSSCRPTYPCRRRTAGMAMGQSLLPMLLTLSCPLFRSAGVPECASEGEVPIFSVDATPDPSDSEQVSPMFPACPGSPVMIRVCFAHTDACEEMRAYAYHVRHIHACMRAAAYPCTHAYALIHVYLRHICKHMHLRHVYACTATQVHTYV